MKASTVHVATGLYHSASKAQEHNLAYSFRSASSLGHKHQVGSFFHENLEDDHSNEAVGESLTSDAKEKHVVLANVRRAMLNLLKNSKVIGRAWPPGVVTKRLTRAFCEQANHSISRNQEQGEDLFIFLLLPPTVPDISRGRPDCTPEARKKTSVPERIPPKKSRKNTPEQTRLLQNKP
jgi:hypothetical protein